MPFLSVRLSTEDSNSQPRPHVATLNSRLPFHPRNRLLCNTRLHSGPNHVYVRVHDGIVIAAKRWLSSASVKRLFAIQTRASGFEPEQNMLCRVCLIGFCIAYGFALFVFLTGTFGWFGQEQDPLSGIFLLPLGLPWNLTGLPDRFLPLLGAASPLINLTALALFCRWRASNKS